MTDRELMQQALDALITAELDGNCEYGATDALRARLAQPEQEPVATLFGSLPVYDVSPKRRKPPTQDLSAPLTVNGVPMYPQREWQGLMDEEVRDLWSWSMTAEAERTANTQQHAFARAVESKLKEKNHAV